MCVQRIHDRHTTRLWCFIHAAEYTRICYIDRLFPVSMFVCCIHLEDRMWIWGASVGWSSVARGVQSIEFRSHWRWSVSLGWTTTRSMRASLCIHQGSPSNWTTSAIISLVIEYNFTVSVWVRCDRADNVYVFGLFADTRVDIGGNRIMCVRAVLCCLVFINVSHSIGGGGEFHNNWGR